MYIASRTSIKQQQMGGVRDYQQKREIKERFYHYDIAETQVPHVLMCIAG
jgi:hypothetical protein